MNKTRKAICLLPIGLLCAAFVYPFLHELGHGLVVFLLGAKVVEPQVLTGKTVKGAYMLCSDGFRHEITEREMYESLNPINLMNKKAMHSNAKYLIEQVKSRQEKDNISVVLIRTE